MPPLVLLHNPRCSTGEDAWRTEGLLVSDARAVVGRPPERVLELLPR